VVRGNAPTTGFRSDDLAQTIEYDAAGRVVRTVRYAGGLSATETVSTFDAAGRLTAIEERVVGAAQPFLRTEFEWRADNVVVERRELSGYDAQGQPQDVAVVTYEYDARQQLRAEYRTENQADVYYVSYTYDQLGNRLTRSDVLTGWVTWYTYDVTAPDPAPYSTHNNRLLRYDVKDEANTLVRRVRYTYWDDGNVSNITVIDASAPTVAKDLAMYYNQNGELWLAVWGQWDVDAEGDYVAGPTGPSYVATAAREYRGSGRARYLCRDVDPTTLQLTESGEVTHWTDYIGDSRYGDFATSFDSSSLVTTERRAYAGTFAERTHDVPAVTRLLHGDLVGSTGWLTDAAGQVTERLTYTAFGEPVTQDGVGYPPAASDTRYGYGGAWGYETGLLDLAGADANLPPVRLLHVGYRWYQPDIGRFVQRDPIGIAGGLNVHLYVAANPITATDPVGLWTFQITIGGQYFYGPFGGFAGNGDVGIVIDGDSVRFIGTIMPGGVCVGAGAGAGPAFQYTTAPSAKDLRGPGLQAVGVLGPGSVFVCTSFPPGRYVGGGASLGRSGLGGYGGVTFTKVSRPIGDMVGDAIYNYFPEWSWNW